MLLKLSGTLIIVLSLCVPIVVQGERPFTIELTSYRHEFNSDFIDKITLQLLNFTDHQAINGSLRFSRVIDEFDIALKVTVAGKQEKSRSLFNVKTDGCQFLTNDPIKNKGINILSIIWGKLQNMNVKFPDKCPVKEGTEIVLNKFYIDADKGPPTIPPMKVNVIFSLKRRNVDILNCFVTVDITSKNVKRQKS